MRKIALAALLTLPFALQSCAVVAGVGAGTLVASETMDNSVYIAQLTTNADMTWAEAKVALSKLSLKPIAYENEARHATAEIDGATVSVDVATFDLNRSELRVSAKRWYGADGKVAKMVYDKLVADIDAQRSSR